MMQMTCSFRRANDAILLKLFHVVLTRKCTCPLQYSNMIVTIVFSQLPGVANNAQIIPVVVLCCGDDDPSGTFCIQYCR